MKNAWVFLLLLLPTILLLASLVARAKTPYHW